MLEVKSKEQKTCKVLMPLSIYNTIDRITKKQVSTRGIF